MLQDWTDVLTHSFQEVWTNFALFVPKIIAALIVFAIGWLIGTILARIIAQVVDALKIDRALKSAGVDEIADRAGVNINAGGFLGGLVKWFVIIVFLVMSLDIIGLQQVNYFLQNMVLLYLPQVIVAVLILLFAVVVAEFIRDVITGAARAAGVHGAKFLGSIARYAIWVFAILAALVQLGVAAAFLQTLFAGVVVALSLAFGLAFGLGGRDAAADVIAKVRKDISSKKRD